MEHLKLDDPSGAQTPVLGSSAPTGLPMPQPPNQQLPPQMFTTAAQLLDLTDKKLMVSLRDGRKLIGVLRSWDQFANLVLQSTIERIFIPPSPPPSLANNSSVHSSKQQPGLYADVPVGIFLVRGENVLLLGEIDLDTEDDDPAGYERGEVELVKKLMKERKAKETKWEKVRGRRLREEGFEGGVEGEGF